MSMNDPEVQIAGNAELVSREVKLSLPKPAGSKWKPLRPQPLEESSSCVGKSAYRGPQLAIRRDLFDPHEPDVAVHTEFVDERLECSGQNLGVRVQKKDEWGVDRAEARVVRVREPMILTRDEPGLRELATEKLRRLLRGSVLYHDDIDVQLPCAGVERRKAWPQPVPAVV